MSALQQLQGGARGCQSPLSGQGQGSDSGLELTAGSRLRWCLHLPLPPAPCHLCSASNPAPIGMSSSRQPSWTASSSGRSAHYCDRLLTCKDPGGDRGRDPALPRACMTPRASSFVPWVLAPCALPSSTQSSPRGKGPVRAVSARRGGCWPRTEGKATRMRAPRPGPPGARTPPPGGGSLHRRAHPDGRAFPGGPPTASWGAGDSRNDGHVDVEFGQEARETERFVHADGGLQPLDSVSGKGDAPLPGGRNRRRVTAGPPGPSRKQGLGLGKGESRTQAGPRPETGQVSACLWKPHHHHHHHHWHREGAS